VPILDLQKVFEQQAIQLQAADEYEKSQQLQM